MHPFAEYALLIAVAIPVATLLAMNLLAAAYGERDTLLLPPMPRAFPAIGRAPRVERAHPRSEVVDTGTAPAMANDGEWESRKAA